MSRARGGATALALVVGAMGFATEHDPSRDTRGVVRREITRAAVRHRIDPKLADAVAKIESGYKAHAVSGKGAVGVMQLMPGTAKRLHVNPWDYRQNIEAGVRYLRWLLERYNWDMRTALAAYNAGPRAVEAYAGMPPYEETRTYVGLVLSEYYGYPVRLRGGSAGRTGSRQAARSQPRCGGVELSFDAAGRLYLRSCSVQ
jgi:soluble lytic murein transglycosylase-like protein